MQSRLRVHPESGSLTCFLELVSLTHLLELGQGFVLCQLDPIFSIYKLVIEVTFEILVSLVTCL